MVTIDAYPLVRLQGLNPDKIAIKLLPETMAREHMVVPLWLDKNVLVIACTDPMNRNALRQVEAACRRSVRPLRASYLEIQNALDDLYQVETGKRLPLDLGGILFQLGYLSPKNFARLRSLQSSQAESTIQICRNHHLVNDENLAEAVGVFCSLPYFRLRGLNISPHLSILFSWEVATKRKVIPLWWISGTLVVAAPELQAGDHLEDISASLGVPIQPLICSYSDWARLYKKFYLRGNTDRRQQDLDIPQRLLKRGILSSLDLDNARAANLQTGRSLEEIIVNTGLVSRSQWMQAQSDISGMPIAPDRKDRSNGLADFKEIPNLLPFSLAKRFLVLPMELENSKLSIAISNPDQAIVRLVGALTGFDVVPYLLAPHEINKRLDLFYQHVPSHNLRFFPGLGKLLLMLGFITENQLIENKSIDAISDLEFGQKLISAGYLDELGLIEVLSLQTGVPRIGLDHARVQPESFSEVPLPIMREHLMLPIWSNDTDLLLAMADPFDEIGLKKVEAAARKRIWPIIAPRSVLLAALERLAGIEGRNVVDSRVSDLFEKLIGAGYLTQMGAANALKQYSQDNLPLDKAIAGASVYSHKEIAQAIANIFELPFVDLRLVEQVVTKIGPLGEEIKRTVIIDPVDEKAARLLSFDMAERLSALPVRFSEHGEMVVAFADPLIYKNQVVNHKIIPVMAYRKDLEEAIQRILGKRNIGTYLMQAGLILQSQLNVALDFARSTGVRLGQALVNRRYITDDQLYHYLSKQASIPFYELKRVKIDENISRLIPPRTAREHGILPILEDAGRVIVATVDPFNSQALSTAKKLLGREISPVLVTENDLDRALENLFSREYLAQSISDLLERTPEDSAFRVLSKGQIISLILILLLSILWLWVDFTGFFITLNILSTLFYFTFSTYKFYLIYRALSHDMEVPVNSEELQALNDRDLPVYTILVPVYKEADVLPQLLDAINRLDYPTTKLDIQVLMEKDDQETIAVFNNWNGPSHFHGVVVPYGEPKTKPKACNYGLIHARGDYIVIFDAEDVPDPDQLKKVVAAFSKSPAQVACIQAKLNYYNSEQNLLTQWFTIEYSMWFDLFLPGLSASNAPIPLGGTSNHFKRDVLIEIGAWDPYNVTEDADLGIRLFKRGYKTAIIDSTTYEEANSQVYNWMRQRSRWMKGYVQTWLVHMRNPLRLIKEIGFKAFLSFQFVVGATFFAALMNPLYWLLTSLWFLVQWKFINVLFPGIIFFLGAFALFFGNFAFTYINVAGALRREKYALVKYALISPLYWAFQSIGAWMGFIQLFYKPHFWEKTIHGLYEREKNINPAPTD